MSDKPKTMAGLAEAFAGESQAYQKYSAYAKQADSEGYGQVARMFRAAAAAEVVHAQNHFKAMAGIGDTLANLKDAIAGETHEYKVMYPPFIEAAKAEGHKEAQRSFEWANKVEATHAALYKKLLDSLSKDMDYYPYYICPVCGHTEERSFPDFCPVCGAKGALAKKID